MKVSIARSEEDFSQLEEDLKSSTGLKFLKDISDMKKHRIFFIARSEEGKLLSVAAVNEESFHQPGYVGIGAIDFTSGSSSHDVARAIIAAIFRYAKSVNKGVRNTSLDPNEKWQTNLYRSVASNFTMVPFIQA